MKHAFAHHESRLTRPLARLTVLALATVLLAGCTGGGSAANSAVGRASGGAPAQDSVGVGTPTASRNSAQSAPSAPGASSPAQGSASGAAVVGVGPKLTKSAGLDLQVKNIDTAAAQVRTIAAGLQAQVLNEQIGTGGPGGPAAPATKPDVAGGFGTLTLSVPAATLDAATDQLARIGTVLQRTLSTQDVTAQYVDIQSRLTTMRASVGRVRALMAQAKDLGQVVALEGELSQREADLESLESQQGALANSVERSTLVLSLRTPGNQPVTKTGFVAGLHSGWDAFAASAAGLLTGIGAVLPFAVSFALAAAPIAWWLRRRRSDPASQVQRAAR
jgi:Domain of unknown function (DUF4349)